MAYSRIYDIQIRLYEKDMDDFYKAVKIYKKRSENDHNRLIQSDV